MQTRFRGEMPAESLKAWDDFESLVREMKDQEDGKKPRTGLMMMDKDLVSLEDALADEQEGEEGKKGGRVLLGNRVNKSITTIIKKEEGVLPPPSSFLSRRWSRRWSR